MWATSEKALNTSLRNLGCLLCVKRGNSKFLSKRISWKSRLHTVAGMGIEPVHLIIKRKGQEKAGERGAFALR